MSRSDKFVKLEIGSKPTLPRLENGDIPAGNKYTFSGELPDMKHLKSDAVDRWIVISTVLVKDYPKVHLNHLAECECCN